MKPGVVRIGSKEDVGRVRVQVLGGFTLSIGGREIGADAWPARRAAELVQFLALRDRHQAPRDVVIEALWPHLDRAAGGANLRKAAHLARKATAEQDAVVLDGGQVLLFPGRDLTSDLEDLAALSRDATATQEIPDDVDVERFSAPLLPGAMYEEWTAEHRERARRLLVEVLRASNDPEGVVAVDPLDERAYRELMLRDLEAGNRPAAIRWFGRLRVALRQELGILPDPQTLAVYEQCVAGLGGSEPELVGRELELATAISCLRTPTSQLLAIQGPGGIGKTALSRELARQAERAGWRALYVGAEDADTPYGPVAALVDDLVSSDRSLLDQVGGPARSILAQLTPVAEPAEPLDGAPSRHRVIGSFKRLLRAAAGDAPALLIVDDAHLADEATLDLLGHLGWSVGEREILSVVGYRPESPPQSLIRLVERLKRADRVVEIDLGPLDREQVGVLVEAEAPSPKGTEVVDRIAELGGGNPFLTLELARSAVVEVPALVGAARDAIAARLVDLDEDSTTVLRRLALAGYDLDPSGAVALAGVPEEQAFASLEAALRSGVLVVEEAHYRFRHELVRQALVDQLPPHERASIHRETAERLTRAGAEPGRIARHWLDADQPRDAAPWLLESARRAMSLGAYGDAVAQLDPLLAYDSRSTEGLRLRAEALDALGDQRCLAAYDRAAEAADDPLAEELRAKRALATIKLGDPEGALELARALEPETLEGKVAHALALSGCAALGFADPKLGTQKAAEARRLALRAGNPDAVVVASWAHAAAAHARGELRESIQMDLRETSKLGALAVSVFDGQLCMTQRLLYGSRPYPDVIAFADSLEAEAKRTGAARGQAFAVTIRGEARLLAGELNRADSDLALGAALHREIGAATGEAFALQRRSEVALHRGDETGAAALLAESLAVARDSDVGFHLLDRIYGTRLAAASDPRDALAALDEAEEAVRGPLETCPTCRITLAIPAAIAAARAGDRERLAAWEPVAEYLSQVVMRLPAWDAALEEVRGHRSLLDGETKRAREHFRAAASGFRGAGQPLDEARCAALAS